MLGPIGLFVGCERTQIERLGFAVLRELLADAREVVERRSNARVFRFETLFVDRECANQQRCRVGIEALLHIHSAQRAQGTGQVWMIGATRNLCITHLALQPFDVFRIEPAARHSANGVRRLLLRSRRGGDQRRQQPDANATEKPLRPQPGTRAFRIDSTRAPMASSRASSPFTQTSCTPVGNPRAPLP